MALDASLGEEHVPAEKALLVIDMQGYSKIPEAKKEPTRSDMDDILSCVLAQVGLEMPCESNYSNRGDGAILVFAPHLLSYLVDPVLTELNAALLRYEQQPWALTIRLRASVHVGPLTPARRCGDAIDDACRLVDSQAAYNGLTAAHDAGAFLSAVLSETTYSRTVAAGRTRHLTHHHFLATTARVESKGFADPCRIHVPGLTEPGLRAYLRDDNDKPELPSGEAKQGPDASPGQRETKSTAGDSSSSASIQFHASVNDSAIANEIDQVHIGRGGR